MASKRFFIVPDDSSAAKIPRPGATIACATLFNSARFIGPSSTPLSHPDHSYSVGRRNGSAALLNLKYFDAGKRFAFHPLQERAARRRHVGQSFRDASRVERRDGVSAAGYRNEIAGFGQLGGRFRHFNGADIERFELEGTERPIPHQ